MDKQDKIICYRQLNQTARKTICRLWCTTAASAAS